MVDRTLIGKSIGKYLIEESLGRGGMAEVYRAYQESLDRYVAIKIMHAFLADEEGFLTRFKREAKAMASLNHNNIVSVYDFDVQANTYYIVMEFVSGGTLKQRLETLASNNERLPLAESLQYVLEIASALAYAHSRGMVHRDIKPGNIMLNDQGHAILTDFGIAKILSGPSFTATGAMIGTPAYMSPEQGLGQPGDERSDIYSLGVLFYQMITGRLPYDADTPLAVILKHVNEPIPEPAKIVTDLPKPIQDVMVKAMAKDPNDRYLSAKDMANALKLAVSQSNMAVPVVTVFDTADLTPPPATRENIVEATRVAAAGATVVSSHVTPPPPPADATRVSTSGMVEATEVVPPMTMPPAVAQPAPAKKRNWILIGAVLIGLLAIIGVGSIFVFGGGKETPTPESTVEVVAPAPTDTSAPTETTVAGPTPNIAKTAVAEIAMTLTAVPTETPEPEDTATPTPEATPDATGTFIASCEIEIELVNSYTFQNERSSSVQVNAQFPMSWVIRNSGTCPLEEGLQWAYVDGEPFGQDGPVILEEVLMPGDEMTLTASLKAPARQGTYESTWQFQNEDGNPVGSEFNFEVIAFVPATATPRVTNTPTPPPTAQRPFNYNFSVGSCEYRDINWRCIMYIEPYGGVGPYRFTTDESPQPEYTGVGPFSHPVVSPRCSPWVHTISVIDQGTGQTFSEAKYIDPNNYFPGGCVMPSP